MHREAALGPWALALFLALSLGVAQAQFRPLSLSGKVVMDDGTPPPEPAVIEVWCESERLPQQFTDRKGNFSFQVSGDESRRLTDARQSRPGAPVGATGSDRSHVSMSRCVLQASLPGYTSSRINLGRRSVFESPDVGTIVLRPVAKGEGTFVSINTLSAPDSARKAFERAEKEMAKERPNFSRASADLERAVKIYPEFAAAWELLGRVRASGGDLAGAREAFQQAVNSDPKFVPPQLSLAVLGLQEHRWPDVVSVTGETLALLPDLPEAHYYRAVAQSTLGNVADAEASLRLVQDSVEAEKYPRTHFLLGTILADRGDIPGAAAEFRAYLDLEPASRAAEVARKQLDTWKNTGLIQ